MISLMACTGRPARRASSACESPRASIASARVSPGGMATLGHDRTSIAIMIAHFLDTRGLLLVLKGQYDPPPFPFQIDREPPPEIAAQSVEVEMRDTTQVGCRI